MALALTLVLTWIALVTLGLFVFHPWWFPSPISSVAIAVDRQFLLTFIICGALFFVAQFSLAYLVWRYRAQRKGAQVRFSLGNPRLEHVWALLMASLFFGLCWTGYRVWARDSIGKAGGNTLRIEVWGEQFAWYFRYPGPDGIFGPVHPNLINDGMGNYLGLDREHDAAARDDIVTATLGVPVDRPVELILRSKDVIHSFFVRELRLKQDAVPRRANSIGFVADRTGRYQIICSDLCGLGHYKMHAELDVMTTKQFEQWLLEESKRQ
jgi:cytochrome c oxidase subunit 2